MNSGKPIIGILGAGKLGTVVTQLALKAGYKVYIAGSTSPEKIRLSVEVITPGAVAVTATEAIEKSDVVILALPLSKYKNLPVDSLSHKLVIDAMNYWWEVDGTMPDLERASSSSEMIQAFLPHSRVTKALSHIGYHHLLDDAQPVGAQNRKAIAIAGNNADDLRMVADIISDIGFEPITIGSLSAGKILEPGNALFGASISANEMEEIVRSSK